MKSWHIRDRDLGVIDWAMSSVNLEEHVEGRESQVVHASDLDLPGEPRDW